MVTWRSLNVTLYVLCVSRYKCIVSMGDKSVYSIVLVEWNCYRKAELLWEFPPPFTLSLPKFPQALAWDWARAFANEKLPPVPRHSRARHDKVRHGTPRHDKIRQGTARHEKLQHSTTWHGTARHDKVQNGTTRYSMARQDTTRYGTARHDKLHQGTARHDKIQHGTAPHVKVQNTTRYGTARHD